MPPELRLICFQAIVVNYYDHSQHLLHVGKFPIAAILLMFHAYEWTELTHPSNTMEELGGLHAYVYLKGIVLLAAQASKLYIPVATNWSQPGVAS